MNEKCALYIRVSSDLQDYERQISDLKKFAQDQNFDTSKINIYEDKISGFKDENEREGLKKLLKEVIDLNIKIVLIWELSRLARSQKNLIELTNYFQQHQIDVYFFIQRFWLLDETKKISPQAGLSISVFGWHAEYEARLTRERFISAKTLNETLGKYNGGHIKFGFTLNENNYYIPNEKIIDGLKVSEVDIVREVFSLYEKGLTCSKICRECRVKGYPKIVCSTHTLARLLRDTSYIGYKKVKLGKRPTPRIIEDAQFKAVQLLIESNRTKADKGKKHTYLLRGVLKCSHCNEWYVGKQTDDAYICPKNSGSNKTNKNSYCAGSNISVSNLDGIIWRRVRDIFLMQRATIIDEIFETNNQKIKDLNTDINDYKKEIDKLEQQRKRINFIFSVGGSTPDEYTQSLNRMNNEKMELNRNIASKETTIRFLEQANDNANTFGHKLEKFNLISDRKQMQLLIKSLIKEIEFYRVDQFKKVLLIKYNIRYPEGIIFNPYAKKSNSYKVFDARYIRFEKETKKFYALKNKSKDLFKSYVQPKKRKGKVSSNDNAEINKFWPEDLRPIPNNRNCYIYDFNSLNNNPEEIPNYILETDTYNKMTYFQDLKKSRFTRRRQKNKI